MISLQGVASGDRLCESKVAPTAPPRRTSRVLTATGGDYDKAAAHAPHSGGVTPPIPAGLGGYDVVSAPFDECAAAKENIADALSGGGGSAASRGGEGAREIQVVAGKGRSGDAPPREVAPAGVASAVPPGPRPPGALEPPRDPVVLIVVGDGKSVHAREVRIAFFAPWPLR